MITWPSLTSPPHLHRGYLPRKDILNNHLLLTRRCPPRLVLTRHLRTLRALHTRPDPALPLNLNTRTAGGLARNLLLSSRVPGACSIECVKSWVFQG